ncbi:MAG: DNA repair protein RecN [Bacteroidales bacterium]|nr:DNA repair protein RecN [Bacteroidales bacterium]
MLRRLTINNYALIDVLDIEIPEHLVIITGDSGAGKSIMLGALALLLGGKYDGAALKDASRNCVVEAQFDSHIVRRVVTAAGRSRVFIDDEPASMEEIRTLAAQEIDIHSQNSQRLLGDDSFCLSLVDTWCGNAPLLEEYRLSYNTHASLLRDLRKLREERLAREKEREYTQFRFDQLVAARLQEGELQQLEEEQKTLANAEQIKETLSAAVGALSQGESPVEQQLKEVVRSLQKIAAFLPEAEELGKRLESCRIELKDVCDTLETRQEKIDASPQKLQQIEERIAQLYELMRRNDAGSEEELIARRESYREELEETGDMAQREAELEKQVKQADELCTQLCGRLTEARKAALEPLSAALQQDIRELDMPRAQFKVECEALPQRSASGAERVRLMFAPAGGDRFNEVAKCASGGELSRIMLCIKALLAQHKALPTVIFDEIDTGMSGSLADKVGRKIVDISKNIQVIAITHLPQVAAKGGAHYLVYKEYTADGAASRIRRIEGQERVSEIARMISGSSISSEALAAAQVLLREAN